MNIKNRTIYCKDNLDILQNIDSESIDMIYKIGNSKQW